MDRIIRIIIFGLIVFAALKFTTFGWRFFTKSAMDNLKEDSETINNLKKHAHKLSKELGDRSVFRFDELQKSAEYITDRFRFYGYIPEFQEFHASGRPVKNIIALKRGVGKYEEIVIVCAHYDTCFNPGADDNASSVAVLLELARTLAKEKTDYSVKFIAFVNEEPPHFQTNEMGSLIYAKQAKQGKENIKAVFNLESVGYYTDKINSQRYPVPLGAFYPNRGNFIAVVGNLHSRKLLSKFVKIFKKYTRLPVETLTAPSFITGVDFSDHWSFWKEGFPALMLTDTALYRNPHYHKDSDTYEKLNFEAMAELTNSLAKVLTELKDL